jgi:hypothetical protein
MEPVTYTMHHDYSGKNFSGVLITDEKQLEAVKRNKSYMWTQRGLKRVALAGELLKIFCIDPNPEDFNIATVIISQFIEVSSHYLPIVKNGQLQPGEIRYFGKERVVVQGYSKDWKVKVKLPSGHIANALQIALKTSPPPQSDPI